MLIQEQLKPKLRQYCYLNMIPGLNKLKYFLA
jgi:hypothetical protein